MSPAAADASRLVVHELALVRFARLVARLTEGERFQREALEGTLTPHPDNLAEHEKMQAWRAGMADGLARAARYCEAERLELARISRAYEVQP